MTPLFFGERSRRLFGLYTPAHATGGKQRGMVLCHPWGQEYLRAHRSMCQLGRMLAASGCHVLRFDYFGTGDSAGDMTEADLKGWQADVAMAVDELKDTAGLQRVGLLGLRLGASLAAQVAGERRKDIDTLVLWDPVVKGTDYLAELHRTDGLTRDGQHVPRDSTHVMGFPLSSALARDIEAIDLVQHVPAMPARTFVAVSESLPAHQGLRDALAASPRGPLPMELIEALPAWLEDHYSGAGAIPVKVLKRIVEWQS